MNLCFMRKSNGASAPIYGSMKDCHNSKNQIGKLYHLECFVLVSTETYDGSADRYSKIEFRNSSGSWRTGWIKYNGGGVRFWEDNAQAYVNGNPRYKVQYTTNIYNGGQDKIATLNPGDYVYTKPGSAKVGSSQHDWLKCFAYKKDGTYKEPSYSLYVDTQIKHGPTKPHVRGNW